MKSLIVVLFQVTAITCVLASPLLHVDHEDWDDDFNISKVMKLMIPASAKRRARRSVRFPAIITFAANDEAWLYINQVEKAHINDPGAVKQVFYDVMRGDVIAVKARSNGRLRGVAVVAEYQRTIYPSDSESDGAWKAHKATSRYNTWMSKRYSSCSWWYPVAADADIVKAPSFPYGTGASYVWANPRGRGDKNFIWMRHVVGEENCRNKASRRTPRKRLELCDLRKPSCKHKWGILSKKDNDDASGVDNECRCESMKGPVSKCYKMHYKGSQFGRCVPYICAPKYECVENGGKDLPLCVRRVTTTKIVPHPTFRRYCKKIAITPTTFYVLSGR